MFTLSVHLIFIERTTCAAWVNLNKLFCVKTATVFSLSPMRLLNGGLCPSQSSGALEGSGRRQEVPLGGTIEKWPRAQGTWPDYATRWTTLSSSGRSILPRIVSNLLATGHFDQRLYRRHLKKETKCLDKAKTSGCILFMWTTARPPLLQCFAKELSDAAVTAFFAPVAARDLCNRSLCWFCLTKYLPKSVAE